MKHTRVGSTVIAVWLAASSARAMEKTPEETPSVPALLPACDLTGFEAVGQVLEPPVAIPDHDPAGITFGPLTVPAGPGFISSIVLQARMQHTWVGDLRIRLGYDETCDATIDAQAIVLCRPRGVTATTPAPCGPGVGFGCSGDLSCANSYVFDDASPTPLGVESCPAAIPSGCYRPPVDGGVPLAVFTGRPKGGCWSLTVIDATSGDIGSVCEWIVWQDEQRTIGVAPAGWDRVKTLYRDAGR